MKNYQEVKLNNTQSNKLKTTVENKTGEILKEVKLRRWRIATWVISNNKRITENKKWLC